jgi:DNA-binding response OmpR family regulator
MDALPKIIVLDDEAELRNMLQRFLTSQGFDVRVVENGKRLDRYLQREPYDLLVLDWMMEPEDGLSVCKRLRAEGQTLPILMLTAKGDPVDKVIGLETGADDYLAKPFLPIPLRYRQADAHARWRAVRDSFCADAVAARARIVAQSRGEPRQSHRAYAWPRSRCTRSQHRRTGVAAAAVDRRRSDETALYQNGVGCRLYAAR